MNIIKYNHEYNNFTHERKMHLHGYKTSKKNNQIVKQELVGVTKTGYLYLKRWD